MCRYGARQHSNVRMVERANAGNCEMIISWLQSNAVSLYRGLYRAVTIAVCLVRKIRCIGFSAGLFYGILLQDFLQDSRRDIVCCKPVAQIAEFVETNRMIEPTVAFRREERMLV